MYRTAALVVLICVSALAAVEKLSEKWTKRLETAEANHKTAAQKADNAHFYALQKANQDLAKVYKTILTDATKAGDFDAATELKARITAVEASGARPKPKNLAKFGNHEYAIIDEKLTWHRAKARCEAMGGHLVCIGSTEENAFLKALIVAAGLHVWVGASDEEEEGKWKWLDGTSFEPPATYNNWGGAGSLGGFEHCLMIHPDGAGDDAAAGLRLAFICEWD